MAAISGDWFYSDQFLYCRKQLFLSETPLHAEVQQRTRQRRTDRQRAVIRSDQDSLERVQGKTIVIGQLVAAVALVSQHRMPDGLQMAPDLVHAAADRDDRQQGATVTRQQDRITGLGLLVVQRFVDGAAGGRQPLHQRQVQFVKAAFLYLPAVDACR